MYLQGSVVQTAEASVAQLDAEIREDQQAARQLLQNVSEFVAQIKSLQSALNPPTAKGELFSFKIVVQMDCR
jgi:hypothetical protein